MTEHHSEERKAPKRSVSKIRQLEPRDFDGVIDLCSRVYTYSLPYGVEQLASQHKVFPEGQLVAVRRFPNGDERIVGFAASLIVKWDDYEPHANWYDFTHSGMFTNHDPYGKTLYGAEVMVDPDERGQGVGKRLYAAREELTRRLNLKRIRAGARLRDYRRYSEKLSPEEYTKKIIAGEIVDRTLSFQLRRGFHVLCVVKNYLPGDPESLGYAAVIEWINLENTSERDWVEYRNSEFYSHPE